MEDIPSYSRVSVKTVSTRAPASPASASGNGSSSGKGSNMGFYLGLFCVFLLLGLVIWLAWYFWPSNIKPTVAGTAATPVASITGSWSGYNSQGTKAGYDWKVSQTGNNFDVVDANMPTTKSSGSINGTAISIPGFKLTGTLVPEQKRINWTDSSYWLQN